MKIGHKVFLHLSLKVSNSVTNSFFKEIKKQLKLRFLHQRHQECNDSLSITL